MKIAFDARIFNYKLTGIGHYTLKLIESMIRRFPDNKYILYNNFFLHYNKMKKKSSLLHSKNIQYKIVRIPSRIVKFLQQYFHIKMESLIGDFDMFHSTNYYIVPTNKLIVTIHDMSIKITPQYFHKPLKKIMEYNFKKILHHANGILFDSKQSRSDFINFYNLKHTNNLKTVYIGIDKDEFHPATNPERERFRKNFDIPEHYLLCVGTIEPRKNHKSIISAFENIASYRKDLHLVFAGVKGWLYEDIFKKIEESKFSNRIIYLNYLPQEFLHSLYSEAELFIFPSFYEGFGLPAVEAQACGTPVITSNRGSLKEVINGSAKIVTPESVSEITDAINELLDNNELRKEFINRGLKNSARFDWDETAAETMAFYESIHKQSKDNKIINNL